MGSDFILFIDEAGDIGVPKRDDFVNKGTSEWCVLAGVIIDATYIRKLEEDGRHFKSFMIEQNPNNPLHYTELDADKRTIIANWMCQRPIKAIVIASNKVNLVRYRNNRIKATNENWYYWGLVRYIIERADSYIDKRTGPATKGPTLGIRFERRKDLKYQDDFVQNYLENTLIAKGFNHAFNAKRRFRLSLINRSDIFDLRARDSFGLQLADFVASAFFDALEFKGRKRTNHIPAALLRDIILRNSADIAFDEGLCILPGLGSRNIDWFRRGEIIEYYRRSAGGWRLKEIDH